MKKLSLIICLIFTSAVFAQVQVRPGFKAGLNAATVTNIDNSTRKVGFQGAMFLNIHFPKIYELQIEASYSNQGFGRDNFTISNPYDGEIYRYSGNDVSIHYIGAAISNKFFFIPDVGLHFLVGPSLEINVSDNTYGDIIPIDIAFFAGIGYEFPMGLGLEARYKQGFVDVRDDFYNNNYYDNDYTFGNENDYYYNGNNKLNSVFQLSVYYKFKF
ncbi:outer membrane beta-barrel protein [Bizionia hallyeonensis]|uniref:Outer membrane beta-barrel protein n=1 Tax=Bizionia hallyeonensis TaxID=1123757 RepID=A0ABW0C2D0_9FLAO